MIKKTYISIFWVLLVLTSCTSYDKLKPRFFERHELLSKEWLAIQDFKVFAFNICESYKEHMDPANRFAPCPDNFFEISARDSIRKVEELYLLLHKRSNLAIYMTTISHRFISKKQKGFLNDPDYYKNKFYLRDTEYIYVGTVDVYKELLLFERQEKSELEQEAVEPDGDEKIVLYFKEFSPTMNTIDIEKVHVETVENAGSSDKTIALDKVFSVPFNLTLTNYQLFAKKSTNALHEIEKVHFRETSKGYFEVIFKVKDKEEGYRFSSRKVLYFTRE